ncbi:MAG: dethiobiotin synthase [Balneolaceae bacterium]
MTGSNQIPDRLFITGTDTGVGKTVLSSAFCAGLNAGYWKPVQAGTEPLTDSERVREWTSLPQNYFYDEQFCLSLPMSPHAASEKEGIHIRLDDFKLPVFSQNKLIVEGAGGLLVPVNRRHTMLDLIYRLNLPVLLVARSGLGTINHTLLSIRMLEQYKVPLWGVVLNGPPNPSNEDAIRHFGKVDKLYAFPRLPDLSSVLLKEAFTKTFLSHAS